jgi:hypothetical protein
MANSTNATWMPKNIKTRAATVLGLDPHNPNNTAYKLVTICVFVMSQKTTSPPFFLIAGVVHT